MHAAVVSMSSKPTDKFEEANLPSRKKGIS